MRRARFAGACLVLAALSVTGAVFALLSFAALVMSGGSLLTNLMGIGGAAVGGAAFVTLIGTGLSPHAEEDLARASRVLHVLIPTSAVLSLALLLAAVTS